jgi:polyribonucleotide nucleotidyltransferase
LAASAALAVSTIPIQEVISEVRVSRINGQFKINPTRNEMEISDLDFIIAATEKNIMMVEGEAKECSEEDLLKALQQLAHDAIRLQIKAQMELRDLVGVSEKRDYPKPEQNETIRERVNELGKAKMEELARANVKKAARKEQYDAIKDEIIETLRKEANLPEDEELPAETQKLVKNYLSDLQYHVVRDMIINDKIRLDGRGLEDVRPLDMEVDVLPTPHGAAW